MRGKLLASSSQPSICFGFRIAVQLPSTLPFPLLLAVLTAETLKRHVVGTIHVMKSKRTRCRLSHCESE